MTADAKVGLLLGLFFIVVIAFLVNGLPEFIRQENTSPPAASIPTPTAEDIVLDNQVSQAVHRLYPSPRQRQTQPPLEQTVIEPVAEAIEVTPPVMPIANEAASDGPLVVQTHDLVNQTSVEYQTPKVSTDKSKTHVVGSGENLAVIAQKYYGSEQGNRRIVIQKLYEANTRVLKSPHRVCVGQKLTIPPLHTLMQEPVIIKAPDPTQKILDRHPGTFERVTSHKSKTTPEYIIQDGDNLWQIAKEFLGDGNRYKEILQFNANAIRNADDLRVGMRIKIPPK